MKYIVYFMNVKEKLEMGKDPQNIMRLPMKNKREKGFPDNGRLYVTFQRSDHFCSFSDPFSSQKKFSTNRLKIYFTIINLSRGLHPKFNAKPLG